MNRNYIRIREVVDTYGGDYTYQNTWFEIEDGKEVYYKECKGAKPHGPRKITDQSEIDELNWYAERYREDGSRI